MERCVLTGSVAGAFACGSEGTHTELIDLPTLRRLSEEAGYAPA